MLRVVAPLILLACTGSTPPRVTGKVKLPVRLAEARHADQVELDIFVWPAAAPTQAPGEDECTWWSGDRRGGDVAREGLGDGSLRWAALVVTRDGIDWAGQRVVSLDGAGRLPQDSVSDGLVPALGGPLRQARAVQDAWFEACGQVYRDRPLLVVDQAVPGTTVLAVLRTLSHNRFHRVAALVGDRSPDNRGTDAPEDPGVLAVLRPRGEQVQVMGSLGLIRRTDTPDEIEAMLAAAVPGHRFGCSLVVPEGSSHWGDVAATIDTATAFGSRTALVHSEAAWTPGPEAPTEAARAPSEWLTLDGRAAVHWLDTPTVVPVYDPTEQAIACDALEGRIRQKLPMPYTLQLALTDVGEDPVQPCLGDACVPVAQPPAEDLAEAPDVSVGWQAVGGLDLPSPDAEDHPWTPLTEALTACQAPVGKPGQAIARAVGWLEVKPDTGQPFDAQISVTDPSHTDWARCLGQALQQAPALGPPDASEGEPRTRHAVVKVWIDAKVREPEPASAE